jgi:hypothetical protein
MGNIMVAITGSVPLVLAGWNAIIFLHYRDAGSDWLPMCHVTKQHLNSFSFLFSLIVFQSTLIPSIQVNLSASLSVVCLIHCSL